MIVEKLTKKKNNYIVTIDGKDYEFDEEVVLEYRLVKGKEVSEDTLKKSINKNQNISYYYKAREYAIKYGKSKRAVAQYLINKGLSNSDAYEIVDSLEKAKIINDEALVKSIICSYIRKQYGINLIQHKLIECKFPQELIQSALFELDYDLYIEALNKLYQKVKNKYSGTPYIRKQKVIRYLLSKGYTYEDVNYVQFEE